MVIRLEIDDHMPANLQRLVIHELEVDPEYVFLIDGIVGLSQTDLIYANMGPQLKFEPFIARFPNGSGNMAATVFQPSRTRTSLSTTPMRALMWCCSFCARLRRTRMLSPSNRRSGTSEDSPIVHALIEAAESGKSVTALVELKARFDEATNIRLALIWSAPGCRLSTALWN